MDGDFTPLPSILATRNVSERTRNGQQRAGAAWPIAITISIT